MRPKLRSESDPEQATYDSALRLLARREHTRLELQHKLKLRDFDPDRIEVALDRLTDEGLLNETRFAELYATGRADKGYGPLRIAGELRERGVTDATVSAILEELADFWPSKLNQLHRKKFGNHLPGDLAEQAKRTRFLRHRGFTLDQIRQLFKAGR